MALVRSRTHEVTPRDFMSTAQGAAWLETHPIFLKLVGQFLSTPRDAQERFRGLPSIGMGDNAIVHKIDDLVVKVSTPTSGRDSYNHDGMPVKPENLIGQFRFLNGLGEHLRNQADDITVPDQYFAMNSSVGNLRGEQYMAGWQSLGHMSHQRGYTPDQQRALTGAARERITGAIGYSAFRLGIDFNRNLHCDNILVPEEVDAPESGPLCIIDQPSQSMVGSLAVALINARARFN